MFSLLSDPWVPVTWNDGTKELVSLSAILENLSKIDDITGNPLVRLSILRLLLAISSTPYSPIDYPDLFNLYGEGENTGFLQVKGVPESSAKSAWSVCAMADGNNAALNPNVDPGGHKETAWALLVAFFCDRGGLKANMPGVSRSARKPLHMGRITAFKEWSNLAEFIEFNKVEDSDWLPWWVRPLDFSEPYSGSQAHLLLWPWRRITVFRPGWLAIAAGSDLPDADDPFTVAYASLKRLRGDFSKVEILPGTYDFTGVALNQASPLACRQWRQTIET